MRRYEPIWPMTRSTRRRLFAGALCLTAAAGITQGSEVYKSIDADGKVVYSDHLEPSMSQSTVVQLKSALPSQLHFCWTNCFTLILDNGAYRRSDGTDESWTVEAFSATGVILHRHDPPTEWNGHSQDVVYAGQVSSDRLINVTVNGKPVSEINASWGSALSTLPGSNAERDASGAANPDSSSTSTVSSAAPPPPVPEEDQPTLSEDGSLWTPGYWYWRNEGYFWIPGTWFRPPRVGVLWTPPYWGFTGTAYVFHPGYWGPTVGFYGGVNYGHGYFGNGYSGGRWNGSSFVYNSAVNRVDPAVIHHTYVGSPPKQRSRAVPSFDAQRGGSSIQVVSSQPSPPQTPRKPATTTTVARNTETTATRTAEQATVADNPPVAPPKSNHVTPTRTAPVKSVAAPASK